MDFYQKNKQLHFMKSPRHLSTEILENRASEVRESFSLLRESTTNNTLQQSSEYGSEKISLHHSSLKEPVIVQKNVDDKLDYSEVHPDKFGKQSQKFSIAAENEERKKHKLFLSENTVDNTHFGGRQNNVMQSMTEPYQLIEEQDLSPEKLDDSCDNEFLSKDQVKYKIRQKPTADHNSRPSLSIISEGKDNHDDKKLREEKEMLKSRVNQRLQRFRTESESQMSERSNKIFQTLQSRHFESPGEYDEEYYQEEYPTQDAGGRATAARKVSQNGTASSAATSRQRQARQNAQLAKRLETSTKKKNHIRSPNFVNPKSLKYIKDRREQLPVEDILLMRGQIANQKKEILKEQLKFEHNPSISNYSKNIKREGTVFSRLYQDGQRRVDTKGNFQPAFIQAKITNIQGRQSSGAKIHRKGTEQPMTGFVNQFQSKGNQSSYKLSHQIPEFFSIEKSSKQHQIINIQENLTKIPSKNSPTKMEQIQAYFTKKSSEPFIQEFPDYSQQPSTSFQTQSKSQLANNYDGFYNRNIN